LLHIYEKLDFKNELAMYDKIFSSDSL